MPGRLARLPLFAAALVAAACNDQGSAANDRAAAPPAVPAPAANIAEANAAAPAASPAPAPAPAPAAHTLTGTGIEPGIAFGMPRDRAVAAATAAFGAPTRSEHNDECGEGPMDFVQFHGLSLSFQEGRLAGWSLAEAEPALRTSAGIGVGSPRSALGAAPVEDSTLGPEFDLSGVGGVLDEGGSRVIALWAGLVCQFR
ncbi:MAG TPA: hypothetical protein VGX37_05560 [Allosphingosinicella sp.]|nr:hypothetical protein [Allosphingosinicella sp.]